MAERYDAIIMGGGHNGRTEIKAVLAYYCGIGTFVGPKSPARPMSSCTI